MASKSNDSLIRSVLQTVDKMNRRSYANFLSEFAPSYKMHLDFLEESLDREQALDFMKYFIETFPGVQLTVDEIFVNSTGSHLAYRFTARAKGTNRFMGFPPTDQPVEFEGATIYTLENGLRTESWNYWDNLSILRQLGISIPTSPSTTSLESQQSVLSPSKPRDLEPGLPPDVLSQGEEIILGYGIETATVHHKAHHTLLESRARIFNLEGRPLGTYHGSMRTSEPLNLSKLFSQEPSAPTEPGRPPSLPTLGTLQVTFSFENRGSLQVTGTATGSFLPGPENSLFMIAALGRVEGGTGQLRKSRGVISMSGASTIRVDDSTSRRQEFHFKTLFSIRLADPSTISPWRESGHSEIGSFPPEPSRFYEKNRHRSTRIDIQPPRPHPPWPQERNSLRKANPSDPTNTIELVEGFMRRSDAFLFTSRSSGHGSNRPLIHDGKLVGIEVSQTLHQVDVNELLPNSGGLNPSPKVSTGVPIAKVEFQFQVLPDNFMAHPGESSPPQALDLETPQRIVLRNFNISFLDASRSRLYCFGDGLTFILEKGSRRIGIGANLEYLEGTGMFEDLQGTLSLSGRLEPPTSISLLLLLRLTGPQARGLTTDRATEPSSSGRREANDHVLTFIGESFPSANKGPTSAPRAAQSADRLPLSSPLRTVRIEPCISQAGELHTRQIIGPEVGRMDVIAWFNPFVGPPPYSFQTREGTFSFFDRNGEELGVIKANMIDGQAFPTIFPGVPDPIYRGSGLAPILSGTGVFKGAKGIIMVGSFLSLNPLVSSDIFVVSIEGIQTTERPYRNPSTIIEM